MLPHAWEDPDLNGALIDDLARRLGVKSLLNWVEERTTALARLGWDQRGWVELNERLLGAAGVTRVERDPGLPALACIRPLGDGGYGVYHRPTPAPENQRFWVAHEVAHTFWYRPGGGGVPLSPFQRCIGPDHTLEWLCNRAAAALLLPSKLLERALRLFGIALDAPSPALHLLSGLASRHRVPARMLARRWLHELAGRDLAIVCCRLDEEFDPELTGCRAHKQTIPPAARRMTIAWEAVPRGVAPHVKHLRGRRVPLQSFNRLQEGTTTCAEVDGRWREFLFAAPGSRGASSFGCLPHKSYIQAYVARVGDQVIIAVPKTPMTK